MRNRIAFLLVLTSITTHSQDLFTISLEKFSIKRDSIPFQISEVIDGRNDKKVIGIVQLGMNNRKESAVFNTAGLREVEELLSRSGMTSAENGIVMRISKLYISEVTTAWKETAKAELSADYFMPHQGGYYYLASIYTTIEPNGMDVTSGHASNVVAVCEKNLIQFAPLISTIDEAEFFTREELMDPTFSFRNISAMPIVQATHYKDGYYRTFDEFVNNNPSLDIECKLSLGVDPKIKCGDKEEFTTIYGFARENQLYILFHQRFYLLQKNNNGFSFLGPSLTSGRAASDYARGWVTAGTLGAGIAVSSHKYNSLYRVDLSTGSIKNVTGL